MKLLKSICIMLTTVLCLVSLPSCSNKNNKKTKPTNTTDSTIGRYTISFDLNGGEGSIPNQYIKKGDKIVQPDTPKKEGYSIEGWYYKGEKWSFVGHVVTENMVLKANWTINTYSVNLTVDEKSVDYGTASISSKNNEYNSSVELNATCMPNCAFDGWYDDGKLLSVKNKYTFNMPAKNMNIIAKFSNTPMAKTNPIDVNSIEEWKTYCNDHNYSFDDNYNNRYLFKCTFTISNLYYYDNSNLYNGVSKKSVGCGLMLKDSNGEYVFTSSIWLDEIPWEWNSTYGYYISNEYPTESTGFNTDFRTKDIKVGDSITLVISLSHSSFGGFNVEPGVKGNGNYAWCALID